MDFRAGISSVHSGSGVPSESESSVLGWRIMVMNSLTERLGCGLVGF
jgi:hypothetical protein